MVDFIQETPIPGSFTIFIQSTKQEYCESAVANVVSSIRRKIRYGYRACGGERVSVCGVRERSREIVSCSGTFLCYRMEKFSRLFGQDIINDGLRLCL